MNNPQENTAVALVGPPAWRLRAVQALQLIGVALMMTGSADVMNLIALLNPEAAAWLALSGAGLRFGSEPAILLLGDLLDDGVKNGSFKIPKGNLGLFLVLALCLVFTSCAGFSLAIKGDCALAHYKAQNGAEYESGPCIDLTTGKVNRYVTIWTNPDEVKVRVTRWTQGPKEGATELHYQAADGSWLSWSSKSGVSLGGAPALEGAQIQG